MRLLALALSAAALLACGPNPKAPVKVMAIVPSVQGNYETRQVELNTIGSITALKGSVAELLGGARVVLDSTDPLQNVGGGIDNMTDEQRYEVLVKGKGMDVRGNYIERAGVLWPADFHTWNMVSTYYNFERSVDYFTAIADAKGVPELQKMRVMYWPEVRMEGEQMVDNALYLSFVESFVIVPAKSEPRVPLAMNIGVIGHEVAHRVFNKRVLNDEGIHPVFRGGSTWALVSFNTLKSFDEGLSDYYGWAVTCREANGCRTNFLAASLSNDELVQMRDVGRTGACMDVNLRNAYQTFTQLQWVRAQEMYKVGNLLAAGLWQAGQKLGKHDVLQKSLLLAYDDESATTPGLNQLLNRNVNSPENFTPEAFVNVIAAHVSDPELKKTVCNELSDRLQLACPAFPCTLMPACPAVSTRGSTGCPTLP